MILEELQLILKGKLDGTIIESPKLEFKRKWWVLNEPRQKYEFLKDLSAIANSMGESGRIIIGIDKVMYDAPLPCDESDLQQIVTSNIDPPMRFEVSQHQVDGKSICVVEIPKSNNRPHIVKRWQGGADKRENCIFVRRGSSTAFASRAELDEMYADRQERLRRSNIVIIPDEKSFRSANWGMKDGVFPAVRIRSLIHNRGSQTAVVRRLILELRNPLGKFIKTEETRIRSAEDGREITTLKINSDDADQFDLYFRIDQDQLNNVRDFDNYKIILDAFGHISEAHGNCEISGG